jgi:glycosyltransferase involved in cell wall biosynthesis
MKIAILGSRGIPGNYGGFETFAENLSTLLSKREHELTVYCCSAYSNSQESNYNGVMRVILPTVKKKSLEKLIYNLLSLIHVSFTKNEIILMLGVSVSIFCFIPRIFGKRIAINIDGLEWKRSKWGRFASFYLKFSERMSGVLCDEVITDSRAIQKYYENSYMKKAHYIPYGGEIINSLGGECLKKYGLEKGKYVLQVCRLEPENNAHIVLKEFERVKTDLKLVILGDAPYSKEYIRALKSTRDRRIKFLGAIYGDKYREILSNAYCYIHGHEVGGTNPVLVEAMGAGNCVLVLDVPYNLEVIDNRKAGVAFSKKEGDLSLRLQELIDNPGKVQEYKAKAVERIKEAYTWGRIVNEYESLFRKMLNS